jgi:anti-sigma regulatory factor (Ser/Thr protein kinase)
VLHDGDVAMVIATAPHQICFEAALTSLGVDVASARMEGRWITADAADTLSRFMVDDHPDSELFEQVIGERVRVAKSDDRRLHAYGEMVALLWNDGNVAAAIELEDLWNGLRTETPFSLWCGYRSADVAGADDEGALQHVCHSHSTTVGLQHCQAPEARTLSTTEQSFACSLEAPGAARRFVAAALESLGECDRVGILVVVSELVTNAVLHAASDLSVSVSVSDSVIRVEVRDASRAVPAAFEAANRATNGRGLTVVNAWATRWGTELLDSGKVVWAEVAR